MIDEFDFAVPSAGCLALLWPTVDECLVTRLERSRLDRVAAEVAPLGRVAIELRLAAGSGEIDLHQFICGEADAAILKRHLACAGASLPRGKEAREFLGAWANDDDGLRTDVDHLFLEWDRPAPGSDERAPAIFLPVQSEHERGAVGMRRRERVANHVSRLGLGGPSLARQVREILKSASSDLSISYIGFMLGRGAGAVRINLRGVRPADLGSVLESLAWPGDHAAWRPHFSALVARADFVAVALDFAPHIQPTIGFEAALDGLPNLEPRWPQLLDHLLQSGICTEDKAAALKQVSARLYPEQKGQLWPASWVAATAMAPPDRVPWFERRLSHVKVTVSGDGGVSAKAYVSAQHYWSRRDEQEAHITRVPIGAPDDPALRLAARRAVDFLVAAQSQDDLWRDFRLVNGVSDEWVSGFVGFALAGTCGRAAISSFDRTLCALLRRQRADGGWGYNANSPADADSTAWVLKLLKRLKHGGEALKRGEEFLRAHLLPEGGFSTYATSTKILFGEGLPPVDDAGWRSSHCCVAANAAAVLPDPLLELVRSAQEPEGNWTAYWWRSDVFATALAVQALLETDSQHSRQSARHWARKQIVTANSPFDRAWLIQLLCAGAEADQRLARELCLALVAEQRDNGSWRPGAEMLFPRPDAPARSETDNIILDHKGLLTTASALMAIEEVLALEKQS